MHMSTQAADIVRVVGVGRNEYIAIMNRCKAKKLLWRMNKSVVKDYLPQEPLDLDAQPWWGVNTVNLGAHAHAQLQLSAVHSIRCIFAQHSVSAKCCWFC